MITPHSSEPNTLNKVGNTGRNWVCSGNPISLDLALWHLTKLQGTSITVWRWVLNGPGSTEDAMEREPLSLAPSMNVLLVCFVLFCFPWSLPLQKEQPYTNSLYLFWNNLEFTVELYHWYRGIKKPAYLMLSLYLNYLATVTLIYFVNIQYINVASYNQHWWYAVQFDFPLSEQHPLNCITENALGAWLWKKKNSGVNGLGSLPPAGPGPDQAHLCFLLLSEQMSKTEKLYQWEGKGGQVKVTLPFLKGVTLGCCICSLWRLTKCSVCRFAGMMASMTWQRRKMDRCPASWLGGLPLSSAVWPQLSTPSLEHGAPQPTVLSASPFLKGVSAWAGAVGSPRSHGLGTQHWWLQCRERLKLQSTAHVTQAQNRTRAAPGPRGADGVTRRKQQEHSWESCDALAANWTMTRQQGLHQWGLGTCQLGSEGPRWWHRGYASTWLHEVTMIMATTQKIKQEHTHHPGELNANISLQVWKRLLLQLVTGWGSYGAEGGKDESWSFSCWRWYVCSVWCPSQRTLNECASNHVHIKRNMGHGNSQLSQLFKCHECV